ncbi:hypothetical protein ACKWTF_011513 [Chironomus riparius]
MELTGFQIFLSVLFALSGSIYTISSKSMDHIVSMGIDSVSRQFAHPLLKINILFLGEILCMIAFLIAYHVLKRRMDSSVEENVMTKGARYYNPLILWPPAVLNLLSSSLILFGIILTNSFSLQIISCTSIISVVFLSICIFKRNLKFYEWIGLILIIFGLLVIGFYQSKEHVKDELLGDIMIAVGQFLAACQYIYEEAVIVRLDIPPLQFVGLEGIFGFIILTIFMFPLEFFPLLEIFNGINSSNTVVNNLDAVAQIYNEPLLLVPLFIFMLSVGFYAFSGIYLTKELSAITRMVFDALRIIIVWAFSVALSWQEYNSIQIAGFLMVIIGNCIFNDIYVIKALNIIKEKLSKSCNKA